MCVRVYVVRARELGPGLLVTRLLADAPDDVLHDPDVVVRPVAPGAAEYQGHGKCVREAEQLCQVLLVRGPRARHLPQGELLGPAVRRPGVEDDGHRHARGREPGEGGRGQGLVEAVAHHADGRDNVTEGLLAPSRRRWWEVVGIFRLHGRD